MKKLIVVLLFAILMFCLTACEGFIFDLGNGYTFTFGSPASSSVESLVNATGYNLF